MLNFKVINYKNILSVGNTPVEIRLDSNLSNLMVGKNGAGKSTLLDALTFALYGKPYRDITKPRLINSVNKGHLVVELEFETNGKEYVIRRGMKPNFFEIYEDEKLIDQDAGAYDYQDFLEKNIIRMNYKAYTQIVVLGKVTYVPFMNLKPGPRREVIEDLLDLVTFTTMGKLHKENLDEAKRRLQQLDIKIESTEDKIEFVRKNLAKVLLNTQELINAKKEQIDHFLNQGKTAAINAKEVNTQLVAIESFVNTAISELRVKFDKATEVRNKVLDRQRIIQKELAFFDHTAECPTCAQEITEAYRTGMIKRRHDTLSDLESALVQINERLERIKNQRSVQSGQREQITQLQAQYTEAKTTVKHCRSVIESLEVEIETLKKQHTETKVDTGQVKVLQKELKDLTGEKYKIAETQTMYKIATHLLKDSGLKAQFIKKIIPRINEYIAKYLSALDFYVQFELDENFNEVIKSRYRDEFSYNSFSEGEKFRIDIALLLTWRAIAKARNSCTTNLLILDEIFDSSLDNDGIDELMKIIDMLISEGQTVFVISHKGDALADRFENVLTFEKNKNFTQMVEM